MKVNNQLLMPIISNTKVPLKPYVFFTGNVKINSGNDQDSYNFTHSNNSDLDQLRQLATQYRLEKSIENKEKLFEQEFKILYQELTEPDKYLDRAMRMGANLDMYGSADPKTQLQINALNGLCPHFMVLTDLKLPQKGAEEIVPVIEKLIKTDPKASPLGQELKLYTIDALAPIYKKLNPELKKQVGDLLLDVVNNSDSETHREHAFRILKGDKENKYIQNQLQNKSLGQWKSETELNKRKLALTNLIGVKSPSLKDIIPEVLKDKNTAHSLKVTAVWGAGRIHTEENFKSLIDIINGEPQGLNQEDLKKDLELKEVALSSLALYVKKHPKEVREIMKKISESDSPLKDSAVILYEKVQGKGYIRDNFITRAIPSPQEREEYKKDRGKYIQGVDNLNIKQKSKVDQALLPFISALKKLVNKGAKFKIIDNDTVTASDNRLAGVRTPDGRFWDSVDGVSAGKSITLSKWVFDEPVNGAAHEFNHAFLGNVMSAKDVSKLKDLYNNAKKENRLLDNYAAQNYAEYFAQGYQAYVTTYAPQSTMSINGDYYYCFSTKANLKRKDPELHDFIEYCTKTYKQLDVMGKMKNIA
ncbi:MAG: hypothetical protein ACD_20C00151G0003 [uncultured bacterium]|nr:MAG: hypothetical protein ACD_20C00151G0003 [uncultured bacterium]HBH18118.1 hypothetical protein [Cyanobacteria bacterium UBA9579]